MRIMSLFSKLLFVGSICAGASFAQAQNYELRRQIHFLANKIVDVVNYENLTTEELRDVRDRLQETLNSIGMEQKPSLLCMKNNYGLYYPVNAETGKVERNIRAFIDEYNPKIAIIVSYENKKAEIKINGCKVIFTDLIGMKEILSKL